jgi:hypothetical protein
MNKPARGKWSKSDTDLFYEVYFSLEIKRLECYI